MATLQDRLQHHLTSEGLTVRDLASRVGMSPAALLPVLREGRLPRGTVHREALRAELGLDREAWARLLLASQGDTVELGDGPPTLQQLVMRRLLGQGHTEASFARSSGITLPTVLSITRRGAVPRRDTRERLAEALGLPVDELEDAVARQGGTTAFVAPAVEEVDDVDDVPSPPPAPAPAATTLAQFTAETIARTGQSMGGWSHSNGVPYLSLVSLLRNGRPPATDEACIALRNGLDLTEEAFAELLAGARRNPQPAGPVVLSEAMHPLQAALHRLVEDRGLTTKAFAELADLSVLTATRLLKKGELPGRQTTHQKLRTLLGIDERAYEEVLERSRAAGAAAADEPATSVYQAPTVSTIAASVPELMSLVGRLAPKQRESLKEILMGMLGE